MSAESGSSVNRIYAEAWRIFDALRRGKLTIIEAQMAIEALRDQIKPDEYPTVMSDFIDGVVKRLDSQVAKMEQLTAHAKRIVGQESSN